MPSPSFHRRPRAGLIGVAVLGACGFALASICVRTGLAGPGDEWLLANLCWLTEPPGSLDPAWLGAMARLVSAAASPTSAGPAALILAAWLCVRGRWRDSGLIVIAGAGAVALSQGLKLVFARERPELGWGAGGAEGFSFPSTQTLFATALCLALALVAARSPRARPGPIFALAAAAGAMVGCSRIYLGAHWPSDILASWCLGAGWAAFCGLIMSAPPSAADRRVSSAPG